MNRVKLRGSRGKIPQYIIIYHLGDLYEYPESKPVYTDENRKLSLFGLYLRSPLGEKGEEISPTLLRTPGDLTLLNETRARMLLKIVFI